MRDPGWPTHGRRLRTFLRACLLAVVALWVLVPAVPAGAHADLLASDPEHTGTVPGPVTQVRLAFSADADPVTDEFSIVDAAGATVPIAAITNASPTEIVVEAEGALPDGRNRVYWALRGTDGHVLTGAILFTIDPTAPAAAATGTLVPYTGEASTAPSSGLADLLATLARWVVYCAALVCIGGLGYLAWVHRGTPAEGRRLTYFVRRAAAVVVVASLLAWLAELLVYDAGSITGLVSPGTWGDLLSSSFAIGTLLRLVGGALVLAFLAIRIDDAGGEPVHGDDPTPAPASARSSAHTGAVAVREPEVRGLTRVRVDASPGALVGGLLLVISEAFLGHTASVDPRVVVVASDAVHVVAAGLWATGAFMLAATLRRRRREGAPTDARLLATRFSVMATWALVAVALTGLALGWAILGGVSGLWSTDFGRLLLLKVAVVGVIAALGAYNHRVMVPALVRGDRSAGARFTGLVTVEAGLFVVVLLLTAFLVAASPT